MSLPSRLVGRPLDRNRDASSPGATERPPRRAFVHIAVAHAPAATTPISKLLGRLLREESGQVLPIVGLAMFVLLGMAGLAIDVGHVYLCQRELQASCDASALAGAAVIPTSTQSSNVMSVATNYSAISGGKNIYANMTNIAMVSGYPVLKCLATMQTQGISCVGYLPYNALQVRETALRPNVLCKDLRQDRYDHLRKLHRGQGWRLLASLQHRPSCSTPLSPWPTTTPTAATPRCSAPSTASRVLLNYLDPCGTSQKTCTISQGNSQNSVVRVSLFTFPQIQYPTLSKDTTCSNSPASAAQYTFPLIGAVGYAPGTYNSSTTYQVTPFESDYRLSDTATVLNSASTLVLALGRGQRLRRTTIAQLRRILWHLLRLDHVRRPVLSRRRAAR